MIFDTINGEIMGQLVADGLERVALGHFRDGRGEVAVLLLGVEGVLVFGLGVEELQPLVVDALDHALPAAGLLRFAERDAQLAIERGEDARLTQTEAAE